MGAGTEEAVASSKRLSWATRDEGDGSPASGPAGHGPPSTSLSLPSSACLLSSGRVGGEAQATAALRGTDSLPLRQAMAVLCKEQPFLPLRHRGEGHAVACHPLPWALAHPQPRKLRGLLPGPLSGPGGAPQAGSRSGRLVNSVVADPRPRAASLSPSSPICCVGIEPGRAQRRLVLCGPRLVGVHQNSETEPQNWGPRHAGASR